jgi:hypothetical protein
MLAFFQSSWLWLVSFSAFSRDWLGHSAEDAAPSTLDHPQPILITPEISEFIEELRERSNITGLTVSITSFQDNRTEVEAWGDKTEDGDAMTVEVSTLFCLHPETVH